VTSGSGQQGGGALTDVLEDVDDEERRDQVVDALHVAAGRVADGPDEKDPLEDLSHKTRNTGSKSVTVQTGTR